MNDCPNAEIRDQLPDLLHERLDASARALVLMHVEGCVDCRAELELLRQLNATMRLDAPRMNIASIVAALPSPRRVTHVRRTWGDWRIAAAVTVIAIGGGSALMMSRSGSSARLDSRRGAPVAVAKSGVEAQRETRAPSVDQPTGARATAKRPAASAAAGDAQGLEMTARTDDLSEDQLHDLLSEISKMEAVPMTEPEPVDVPITTKSGAADDARLD